MKTTDKVSGEQDWPEIPQTCVDGHGYAHAHFAQGLLVSPEGRVIQAMCWNKAEKILAEYRDKLGETWTFERDLTTTGVAA